MCTMGIGGFDGVAPHVARNIDLGSRPPPTCPPCAPQARDRGGERIRLLSCAGNTFKYDLGRQDAKGNQGSTAAVFVKGAGRAVRHTYAGKPRRSEDLWERGIDQVSPTWHLLDLTPQGRGDWYNELTYSTPAELSPARAARASPVNR